MTKLLNKMDAWANIMTGLGRKGFDKRTGMTAKWERMTQGDSESLYAADEMAKKINDKIVDESFKKDLIFKKSDMNTEFNSEVWDFLTQMDLLTKVKKAAKWGRLYGGAFLVFGINDGQDPDTPVNFNNIKSVDWVTVLHRWDLMTIKAYDSVDSDKYREPELYALSATGLSETDLVGPLVHESRVVRFDGNRLPDRLYRANNYFHDSVLNSVKDAVRGWNSAYDNTEAIIEEFIQKVFKMKNLANLVGSDRDDDVIKRLCLIDLKKSILKAIVVDADEDFTTKTASVAGLKDLLGKVDNRLTAVSKMPHTILLGEGSTGSLSGSGESEFRQWYDDVSIYQSDYLYQPLMDIFSILFSAKDNSLTKGKIPKGFDIEFPSLYELSDKEKSEIYKFMAEADKIYIESQVLTPDEVAISRFGDGEFSLTTQIDTDIREENLANPGKEEPEEDLSDL